ncbi:fimbrial protein [Salmonella enterica]|nr:fimbrial protein [Salmonella enterica subsp. enterica serovar Typhimurium]EDS7316175.1 fimbrial protein [Salmonella enterica subsp. enterica]EEJ5888933.1 fimbrial protein [Salmonella enterica subsp. enterica serovar Bareilly]EHB3750995.1 fimbrial protein [Salmonella enterica subsp. enterica serovar Newport]EHM9697350.1 fimbrial protein [Salmonella enterica subsp. enterica serovar 4,[5],12,[27]:-:1,2]EIO9870617.1 fimbrial protein [Salmonella enterica]HCS9252596.1 fimbrial protein [Salmonell
MKIRNSITFFAIMLGIISQASTQAATTVNFKGNLIIPDCIINNNSPLEVDFGDVEIQTLDGINTPYHARDFNIPMTCPYILGTPRLTLTSSAIHNAQQGIIQTSKYHEGLMIYLRQKGGGTAVPLGTATNVSSSVTGAGTSRTLTLNAGIGRYKEMQLLTPGPFTASASLQVRYE